MTTLTRERLYTTDDLRALESQLTNAKQDFELIAGVLYEVPTPTPKHNAIVTFLVVALSGFVRPPKLGRVFGDRTGYTLDKGNEFIPDVSYVSYERQRELPERFTIAPDLAVEVVSPSNSADEIQTKTRIYFQYGTRLVWIVYPASRTIVVHTALNISHTLTLADVLNGGDVLPGFTLAVSQVFAEIE